MELAAILAALEASCDVSNNMMPSAAYGHAAGHRSSSNCTPSCAVCVLCVQGKQGSDDVQVPAELLLAAQQELKGKAQMAKDLEMVRARQGGGSCSQPCWRVVPTNPLCAFCSMLPTCADTSHQITQARDEASMKPSVARKLNEKIRGLEAELEELRSNKKVKELEKKVQVRHQGGGGWHQRW